MLIDKVLQEFESLNGKPLDQFIHLSYYLKNESAKKFNSKLISTDPLEIKLRINLGAMDSILDECTTSLVSAGTSYILDKQKTLYVQVDDLSTLRIMTEILHRFVVKTREPEPVQEQAVEKNGQPGMQGIPLAS